MNKPLYVFILFYLGVFDTMYFPPINIPRVVEFASRSDMKNAISKLNGTDLNGRKLKIFEDHRRRWVTTINLNEQSCYFVHCWQHNIAISCSYTCK